jgi:hypothetical protein
MGALGVQLVRHFSGRVELMPALAGMNPETSETLTRLRKTPLAYFRMLWRSHSPMTIGSRGFSRPPSFMNVNRTSSAPG